VSPVRVKICGITRLEDALAAAEYGADALGFNFWPKSKRYIRPEAAADIIARLPPFVLPVGLFVNASRTEMRHVLRVSNVRALQLHGDEPPSLCEGFAVPVLKAIQVRDAQSLRALQQFTVSAFVLDAASEGYGGSGKPFDWRLAKRAASRFPVILAGGLNPHNVEEAVQTVQPMAVDVASGVESAPGIKSRSKMKRLIRAVQQASRIAKT
jgi:phosphoribosylanthranilate isomerase